VTFDVEGARKAGYTDAEIAAHLAGSRQFDVEGARKAGYSDGELIAYLSGAPMKGQEAAAQIPGNEAAQPTPNPEPKGVLETLKAAAKGAVQDTVGLIGPGIGGMGGPTVRSAVETGLSLGTGLTGGAAGMVSGTAQGMVENAVAGRAGTPEAARHVEQRASQGADLLTYKPQSPQAREAVETIGKGMQQIIPIAPILPGLAQPAARSASNARPVMQASTEATAAVMRDAVKAAEEHLATKRAAPEQAKPTPGTMGSVGAAGTDIATQRMMLADELLPENAKLTKGQATRNFEQQRFEKEIAKDPVKGQAIRERVANQNAAIPRTFDEWIDLTGAEKVDLPSVGDAVTKALRERAAREKVEIRTRYKSAEKAGAMEEPVTLADAVKYLNENEPSAAVAPVLDAIKKRAIQLGIAREAGTTGPSWTEFVGERMGAYMKSEGGHAGAIRRIGEEWTAMKSSQGAGQLEAVPAPLKTVELWRQAINRDTNFDPTNIRHSAQIKGLIDAATEGKGGELYRQARVARRLYAERYENFGLARDLLNNKRGMSDAIVPAEKVFQRAILSAPMADVKQIGRLLKAGGDAGRQAWGELQAAALRHIRDEATKNVAMDERGNPVVSPAKLNAAVNQLDQAGKLGYLFGKQGAEQIRALNELAKVIFTSPPGVVNTSNTASVILAALDMATSGVAGMPLPIMSGLRILTTHVRDRQIQKRINEALGIKSQPKVKAPVSIVPRPAPNPSRAPESRTVH
jgi:hypothetical protein